MNSLSIHTLIANEKKAISAVTPAAKALFWSLFLWLAGIFALTPAGAQSSLPLPLRATLGDVSCGALNQRVCTPDDEEYWVANARGQQRVCDYGLTPLTTSGSSQLICGNLNRNTLGNIFTFSTNQDPRGFVTHEQEQAIGADVPINMVNTLGTHNSYSNYQEGYYEDYSSMKFNLELDQFASLFDPWAADQYYSISDQLNAGARYIRIDPYFYDDQLRVCHGPELCQIIGDGRLFIYTIREIADWLHAHPGEFIQIYLNDYKVTGSSQQALEIGIIDEYLSSVLYKPSDGGPMTLTESSAEVFPTLRQLRAMGKQAIIFSANNYIKSSMSSSIWPHTKAYWPHGYDVNPIDMLPDAGQNLGPGCMGGAAHGLTLTQWSNAGEDRSGSMTTVMRTSSFPYFAAGDSDGLMDDPQTNIAARCGVSVIDLDFWGALNHAFHFGVTVDGISVSLVDFRAPIDDRPMAASWSYMSNDSSKGPATLFEPFQQWVSQPDTTNLRYACAALREDPDFVSDGLYDWATTSTAGPWSGGEAACQKLGSQYHFWFPQSTYEQNNLLRYEEVHQGNLNSAVWLNYRSATYGKQLVTAPSQVSFVTAIDSTPAPQTIWVGGGNGGKLLITASGPFQAQQLMSNSWEDSQIQAWPTNQIQITPTPDAIDQIGTQTGTITIQEIDPATGKPVNDTKIPVSITVKDEIVPDVSSVALTPGMTQTIHLSGFQGDSDRIPFQIGETPDWLVAKVNTSTTPATITLSTKSMPKGVYLASLPLIPPGSDSKDATASITIQYVVR